jgi:hypothetical protein
MFIFEVPSNALDGFKERQGKRILEVAPAVAVEERWRGKNREEAVEQAARKAIEPSLKLAERSAWQAESWARVAEQAAKQQSLGKGAKEEKAERSDSRGV